MERREIANQLVADMMSSYMKEMRELKKELIDNGGEEKETQATIQEFVDGYVVALKHVFPDADLKEALKLIRKETNEEN